MESSSSGHCSRTLNITRQELYDVLKRSEEKNLEKKLESLNIYVQEATECSDDNKKDITNKLSHFKSQFKTRWAEARRIEDRFLKNNSEWLSGSISFVSYSDLDAKRTGRPKTSFENCSERTKRQRTETLRQSAPLSELAYASQMGLRASGHTQAAKIVKELCNDPDEQASAYIKSLKIAAIRQSRMLLCEDALALMVDAELTRHQYDLIRASDRERFPSYKLIQSAKKMCFPSKECMTITPTSAKVELQALLDHTVHRLLVVQEEVLRALSEDELKHLRLYCKWGFDGSSGHSSYKQAFHGVEADDSSVFITSVVPVRLVCINEESCQKVIWQNPRPSSTRYCRPLKIEYAKESADMSSTEKMRVDKEIEELKNTQDNIHGMSFEVNHHLILSMVDGKVCNALTENSSTQRCYICGATSKQFNSIEDMLKRPIKTENLQFGLSILHGWIRFFEGLLHLSYKLPLQKWQARSNEDKQVVKETKSRIQDSFKNKCGLLVDRPKPGFGNSNDGNTARRFFSHADISSEITRVDAELIKRLHTILIAISSGHEIDTKAYREFAHGTAKYYVEKYPWYPMSPTLHKFLIHGPEIISSAMLPIGQLSEEAQEARNKDFKKYREHHSRKCSREKSNQDILINFLLSSDPVLTSKRKLPKKKVRSLPKEALKLLSSPFENRSDTEQEDSEDDEEIL